MKNFTTAVIRNTEKTYVVMARIDEGENNTLRKQREFSDIAKARAFAAKIATFVYDHTGAG
jgi:hypothetical protein